MDNQSLAVIVITPHNCQAVRRTLQHLQAQTARSELEIMLVGPVRPTTPADQALLEGFGRVHWVERSSVTSTAAARAAGVSAATAPVVAFAEEHSFPEPGWAAALIAAHRGPWAGVGPAIRNGNPATLTSWANLMIEYAPWLDALPAGAVDHIPGHNSSYKREVLLAYGDELEAMLDAESVLHWDLRARGHQLLVEPAAKTRHFNFSRLTHSVVLRFNGGRLFAAARSRAWGWPRRGFYTLAAPLIPLVRLVKIARELTRPGRQVNCPWAVWPLLFALLVIDGFGEAVGYACGAGQAMARLSAMEFNRVRHLTTSDAELFAGAG